MRLLKERYKTYVGALKRCVSENSLARGEFLRGDKARHYRYTVVQEGERWRVARMTLFRTQFQMNVALAKNWLCAGGLNGRGDMQRFLSEASDEQLATEVEGAWGLIECDDYDRTELIDVFHEIRENFDEHFPQEEYNG